MKTKTFILTVLIFVLGGYASAQKVKLMEPMPNLALTSSNEKIFLLIEEKIPNDYSIKKNGVIKVKVTEWHASLKNGFENGFGDFYTIVDNQSDADLILKLTRADLEFVLVALRSQGNSAVSAQLFFRGVLLNKNGEIIGQTAATAISKNSTTNAYDLKTPASSAIESMYEIIGKELFTK